MAEWQIFYKGSSGVEMGEANQCYVNSRALALELGFDYCEGVLVLEDGRFLLHGFCIDPCGFVVENTPIDCGDSGISLYVGKVCSPVPSSGEWGVDPVEMLKGVVPLLRDVLSEDDIERSLDYFGSGLIPQGKGAFIRR